MGDTGIETRLEFETALAWAQFCLDSLDFFAEHAPTYIIY
jgi:hypothetical protein